MREKNEPVRLVSFLSDFGSDSPFPGIVKGVIKRVSRNVEVVDLTHDVPPGDIDTGALILAESSRWFPGGTVFLAVVDPGVGGARRGIVVRSRRNYFVGPDNGLLFPAVDAEGVEFVREIANPDWVLPRTCETFHGRDVFGPVAARLASGWRVEDVGPELDGMVEKRIPDCAFSRNSVEGICLWVDRFGNVVTSISSAEFEEWAGGMRTFLLRGKPARLVGTFSELERGEVGLVPGSFSRIEVVMYLENASERLGISKGDVLDIVRVG